MGKTKTAVITNLPEEKLSGEEKYIKKQKEQAEKEKKVRAPGLGGGQRIASVDPGPIVEETKIQEKESTSRWRRPRVRGNKYKIANTKIDKKKLYEINEAVELVQQTSYAKFDATVEMHINVSKQDINLRVNLPHSTGVEKKIEIADDATIKKLKQGKIDFDILLAKPEMMPKIVPFAQLLGPRGLMPNPKNGTVIKTEKEANQFSGNNVTVKTEKKQPVIHTTIGKVSFKKEKLLENAQTIIKEIPTRQIVSCYLSSTMGPSVKVKV